MLVPMQPIAPLTRQLMPRPSRGPARPRRPGLEQQGRLGDFRFRSSFADPVLLRSCGAHTVAIEAAEPADLFNHFGNLLGANAPGFQHVMGNVAQAAGGFMQQMQHAAQMRQAHEAHEAAQQAAAEQAHRVHQAAHQARAARAQRVQSSFVPPGPL